MSPAVWIVVLIKDFGTAKSRLAALLEPEARRGLAEANARRALDSATDVAPTLAICGSIDAAELACRSGADVILESAARGQSAAAALGLGEVSARGGDAALILSADLPLVDAAALERLLTRATSTAGPVAIATAALGRRGTNALYLRPLDDFALHFGESSLVRFEEEARRRGRTFVAHHDPCLALDLDEPDDFATWEQLRKTA